MKVPPPLNESARLAKLRSYGLLDAATEPVDERIVRMAARVFGMPMASISLIDESRQWLQAAYGMGNREVARDESFCAHTILTPEIMVVNDAAKDPRFANNPFVVGEPHIRFYAGAPLKTIDGYQLGTLCVLDTKPRQFTPADTDTLLDMAAIVMEEFSLRKTVRRLGDEVVSRQRATSAPAVRNRTNRFPTGPIVKRAVDPANEIERRNQRKQEEAARHAQTALEVAHLDGLTQENPEMFCLATMGGQITYLNEAGRKLTGVQNLQKACETYLADYFPPDQRASVQRQILPAVRVQGRWETEGFLVQSGTGATIPVSWSLFLLRDPGTGESVGIGASARDISQRKANEAVEKEAREAAEAANRAKSEFLASMSHELRTPLNSILGFGQLLGMQAADDGQKECSSHIVNAGRHLLNLINEVLDIARIETGHVELNFDSLIVGDAAAEMIDIISSLAKEKNIAILPPTGDTARRSIVTDGKRFKQVLLNLLSNAVKYSPAGTTVRVFCESDADSRFRVCVEDAGPGIPPDKLARLFVPFERLGAEHSSVPGTGLGLALSKHLTEALGGTIGVDNRPGTGATFWVELPCTGVPPVPSGHPPAAVNGFRAALPAFAAA